MDASQSVDVWKKDKRRRLVTVSGRARRVGSEDGFVDVAMLDCARGAPREREGGRHVLNMMTQML